MARLHLNPYGSQSYPDFLILTEDIVIPLEVKYSKQRKPVWNGGLPRPNGIYIFGSARQKDLTFFRGRDVVTANEATDMREFDDKIKELVKNFNEERMKNQKYGFSAYGRKAYDQGSQYNESACIDFFKNPERSILEEEVLDYLANNA